MKDGLIAIKERMQVCDNLTELQTELTAVAEQIKAIPRTTDGIFDLTCLDKNGYIAAGLVYPIYAAFETNFNKKECYPDILNQMKKLYEAVQTEENAENVALFLSALLQTIDYVSPQLYEYYRELADLFKAECKVAIAKFYENDRFISADDLYRETIGHAADTFVLLREKYERYL